MSQPPVFPPVYPPRTYSTSLLPSEAPNIAELTGEPLPDPHRRDSVDSLVFSSRPAKLNSRAEHVIFDPDADEQGPPGSSPHLMSASTGSLLSTPRSDDTSSSSSSSQIPPAPVFVVRGGHPPRRGGRGVSTLPFLFVSSFFTEQGGEGEGDVKPPFPPFFFLASLSRGSFSFSVPSFFLILFLLGLFSSPSSLPHLPHPPLLLLLLILENHTTTPHLTSWRLFSLLLFSCRFFPSVPLLFTFCSTNASFLATTSLLSVFLALCAPLGL